jgi:hypothetical protein
VKSERNPERDDIAWGSEDSRRGALTRESYSGATVTGLNDSKLISIIIKVILISENERELGLLRVAAIFKFYEMVEELSRIPGLS